MIDQTLSFMVEMASETHLVQACQRPVPRFHETFGYLLEAIDFESFLIGMRFFFRVGLEVLATDGEGGAGTALVLDFGMIAE